ncbi:hypothetical protein [Curtobacterium sp. MCBD17_023]|nr:hypothetical protein [Curtobacterium sp. MCBD17_023]
MGRLVSVGNVIVDIVMRIDALPEPGGTSSRRAPRSRPVAA